MFLTEKASKSLFVSQMCLTLIQALFPCLPRSPTTEIYNTCDVLPYHVAWSVIINIRASFGRKAIILNSRSWILRGITYAFVFLFLRLCCCLDLAPCWEKSFFNVQVLPFSLICGGLAVYLKWKLISLTPFSASFFTYELETAQAVFHTLNQSLAGWVKQ